MQTTWKFPRPSVPCSCAVFLFMGILLFICKGATASETTKQRTFATPAAAVQALMQATRQFAQKTLLDILGPEGGDLIDSGDAVADERARQAFLAAYDTSHSLASAADGSVTLIVGKQEWPLPIPLVKDGKAWRFDTLGGVEEILNRRIGRNELSAIQVCLAIVDAQQEYAMVDRDGDGLRAYAAKFASDPGEKNGLYWEETEGEPPSPLGPAVRRASLEGYGDKGDEPAPYHGYFYRILTSQGAHAPGGAFDYLIGDKMLGGFALIAYPATYGNSGIMTFIVNHDGVVYQKDLGPTTEQIAGGMQAFDPDTTWKKVD